MIVISSYSDRCDFCDHIYFSGVENVLKADIYVGDKKLEAKEYRDLIPYLPYIIGIFIGGKDGDSYIRLSKESYVDSYERETLEWYLKNLLRIYNRCKRKKIPFNKEAAVHEICFDHHNEDIITELANRVAQFGRKAKIDGLHTSYGDFYRKNLVDEMIKYNIDPADFGLERFLEDR